MRMTPYTRDPAPGQFDHRSGDCAIHGVNVVVAREKGSTEPYSCTQCLLTEKEEPETVAFWEAT